MLGFAISIDECVIEKQAFLGKLKGSYSFNAQPNLQRLSNTPINTQKYAETPKQTPQAKTPQAKTPRKRVEGSLLLKRKPIFTIHHI